MVRRTRNRDKLCKRPPCARGMPRARPRPKTSARRPPSQNPLRKCPKRGVCYGLGGGVGRSWSAGLGTGSNFPSGFRVPAGCPRHSRGKKRAPVGPRPKTAQWKRTKTWAGLLPWWGGGAKLVRRTRNGAKHCERPPCARGMLRAQPRPKTRAQRPPSQNRPGEKGPNGGCAIALVGGWGEVGPPDSEWGQSL